MSAAKDPSIAELPTLLTSVVLNQCQQSCETLQKCPQYTHIKKSPWLLEKQRPHSEKSLPWMALIFLILSSRIANLKCSIIMSQPNQKSGDWLQNHEIFDVVYFQSVFLVFRLYVVFQGFPLPPYRLYEKHWISQELAKLSSSQEWNALPDEVCPIWLPLKHTYSNSNLCRFICCEQFWYPSCFFALMSALRPF